jgi:hypothetical protein
MRVSVPADGAVKPTALYAQRRVQIKRICG